MECCFQDGRLRNGDHIMQIDDTNVGTMTSEEVAQVLRKAGNPVRLVIARVITDNSGELPPRKPVVSFFSNYLLLNSESELVNHLLFVNMYSKMREIIVQYSNSKCSQCRQRITTTGYQSATQYLNDTIKFAVPGKDLSSAISKTFGTF